MRERRIGHHVDQIRAESETFVRGSFVGRTVGTHDDSGQFHAALVGKFPAFAKKLQGNWVDDTVFAFNRDPDMLVGSESFRQLTSGAGTSGGAGLLWGVAHKQGLLILRSKEESSFLKKRSKKLLSIASSDAFNQETWMLPVTGKSFLVLFFKKELLSCAMAPYCPAAKRRSWFSSAGWRLNISAMAAAAILS
jgi:hypothetical protein